MVDTINTIAALLTIIFGAFGFLAPRYTASALDLETGPTTMGLSEIRASVGCLFVALGIACLWLGMSDAYFMMGIAYVGATIGRGVSLVVDKPPVKKALIYLAVEATLALWLVTANT